MARHWPHKSCVQVTDRSHLHEIITWMNTQGGDLSYQHWTSHYAHPWLCVQFCDRQLKVEFDLAWS